MGTFAGHALPGFFFIIFSVWWTVQIFKRFYQCKRRNARFTATVTYPCDCLCGRLKDWPLEALLKLLFVSVGFTGEIVTGIRHGSFKVIGNGQHATMFFMFGLSGVIDILTVFKAPLPPDTDYTAVVLALLTEVVLFKFHIHGRVPLDTLLHTLLIYAAVASLFSVLLEMRFRHNVLVSLARTYFFFLQGTWFIQVGMILHNPFPGVVSWYEHNHDSLMLCTMYFAWHSAGVFIFMLLMGAFVSCYQRAQGISYDDDMAMKRLIHTGANGQTVVSLNDDSESDVEYQKPVVIK